MTSFQVNRAKTITQLADGQIGSYCRPAEDVGVHLLLGTVLNRDDNEQARVRVWKRIQIAIDQDETVDQCPDTTCNR